MPSMVWLSETVPSVKMVITCVWPRVNTALVFGGSGQIGAALLARLRFEGWQVLALSREVRADAKLKALPFIMVTAESKSENVIAAKEAGVSNYIVKPFNAETLKAKMVSVLGDF